MGSFSRGRLLRDGIAAVLPIALVIAMGLLAQGLFADVLPRPRAGPQLTPPAEQGKPGRPAFDDDDLART